MSDESRREGGRPAAVLAVALIPRLTIAWVTFGSVDAVACLRNTIRILEGLPIAAPYFSSLELWLWISGAIAFYTPVPLMFPYRLLPIACDALIALLLLETGQDRRLAFRNAMLYAIAPVSIAISAIHPQWDSVWIYFLLVALILARLQRPSADALAGAAFVLSLIIKPIAAPLGLVLLPFTRRRAFAFFGGAAATAAIYLAILAAVDLLPPWNAELLGILHYARHGVRLFGLPYRPENRFLVTLAVLAVLVVLYFAKRLTRDEVALLFLAAAIGVSGLSLQYLMWVIPFALLCGQTRFLAVYSLAAGLFVVFYYQMPVVNLPNTENLGALALLKPFGSWSPSVPSAAWRPFVLFLGNIVVPLSCLILLAVFVARALLRRRDIQTQTAPCTTRIVAPAVIFLAVVAIATVWTALQPRIAPSSFLTRTDEKVAAYDVVRYHGTVTTMRPGSRIWIARSMDTPGTGNPILNVSNLAVLWVVGASLATALWRRSTAVVQP